MVTLRIRKAPCGEQGARGSPFCGHRERVYRFVFIDNVYIGERIRRYLLCADEPGWQAFLFEG